MGKRETGDASHEMIPNRPRFLIVARALTW